MAAVADPEVTLRFEERGRKPAAIAAFAAGLLTLGYTVVSLTSVRDVPSRSFLASVERIGGSEPLAGMPSLRFGVYEFLDDRMIPQIVAGLMLGLSVLAAAFALRFLALATRGRSASMQGFVVYLPVVGAIAVATGVVLLTVATVSFYNEGANTDGTVATVTALEQGSLASTASFLQFFGGLMLGLGYLLVAINAMRVGLLTRFMGVMGIFAGALVLLQGLPSFVIQTFWLVALGLLLLRIWPGNNIPPAWSTGRAEPWPSAADERRARRDAADARRSAKGGGKPAPPEPAAVEARAAEGKPHPTSKKKRKRRS